MSSQKYILFILYLISISYQIPSKDSFLLINSGEQTLMDLTDRDEIYYSFNNQFDSSDIIINIKNGHQYTTRMYIYDNYDSIEINEKNNYINYNEELDLSEKFNYMNNTKICLYYIIIKDLGGYFTKDYINIYNSKDNLELKENQSFTINMFFENNLYTLYFNGEENDLIELNLNINNKDFEQNIEIYKNDINIYSNNINKGIIELNEDKKKGNYKIKISSKNNEIYKNIKSSILLIKYKNKVNQIESEKETNIYYLNSKDIYFYLNLDNYEQNEEGIITFKVSHKAYKNNYLEYCYSKNMNFDSFNDDIFINNMPSKSEDSNSNFVKLNSLDIIYHLYFKKDKLNEEGKKSYLLIHCKINTNEYTEEEKIIIMPSSKPEYIDLSNKDNINEKKNINLINYIPKLYKIKISLNERNIKSYIFSTKGPIQAIYEKTMLNQNYNNEETVKLYIISKTDLEKEKEKIIYIKLFGVNEEIFRIESTNSELYIINNSQRKDMTLIKENLIKDISFYFIGIYTALTYEYNFYFEEIYGKFDIYYKSNISDNDKSILTNGDNNYLINSKIGDLMNDVDILEIKCKEEGYYNLHLLRHYSSPQNLIPYQRYLTVLNKGDKYITLEKNEKPKEINFEINTPLGKEVEIFDENNKKIKINSNNKYYQIQYKDKIPEQIKMNIKEDNTLINILLTDNNLYQIIEGKSDNINKPDLLIKLRNNTEYNNVTINLKGEINSYIYTLYKGDVNYAFNLSSSEYQIIISENNNDINLIFSNPYNKSNIIISDKEESPFYIAIHLNYKGNNNKISIKYDNDKDDNNNDDENITLVVIGIALPLIIIVGIIIFILVKKKNESKIEEDIPEDNIGLMGSS